MVVGNALYFLVSDRCHHNNMPERIMPNTFLYFLLPRHIALCFEPTAISRSSRKILHHMIRCHCFSTQIVPNSFCPSLLQKQNPDFIADGLGKDGTFGVFVARYQIVDHQMFRFSVDVEVKDEESNFQVVKNEKSFNVFGIGCQG